MLPQGKTQNVTIPHKNEHAVNFQVRSTLRFPRGFFPLRQHNMHATWNKSDSCGRTPMLLGPRWSKTHDQVAIKGLRLLVVENVLFFVCKGGENQNFWHQSSSFIFFVLVGDPKSTDWTAVQRRCTPHQCTTGYSPVGTSFRSQTYSRNVEERSGQRPSFSPTYKIMDGVILQPPVQAYSGRSIPDIMSQQPQSLTEEVGKEVGQRQRINPRYGSLFTEARR